jgi:cyclic pyranopterin monophosphate synthase
MKRTRPPNEARRQAQRALARENAPGGGATGALREAATASRLSHVDSRGAARMVDVSAKPVTTREAVARGRIVMSARAVRHIRAGTLKKGDPLQAARLAGIMAAKRTSEMIPLCHPLPLTHVEVTLYARRDGYDIEARVRTAAQTGVEMEALTAVSVAALTVYDMVKAVDKAMVIGDIRLMEKRGGKAEYRRTEGRKDGKTEQSRG